MTRSQGETAFSTLYARLRDGEISRREFLAAGLALGAGAGTLGMMIRNVQALGAAPHPQDAYAAPPSVGTDGKTRGQDGDLKMLLWQAPTHMSPHVSTGTKDYLAGSLVVEALFHYLPDASLWPNLAAEVPTVENGGLSEDLTTVTLKLLPGVVWSDGEPFTAEDVVFTHRWVTDPASNSVNLESWEQIASIEAVDELTVRVTYERTNFNWYVPFSGYAVGPIYPQHYVEANGGDIMREAPIGTGPFMVDSFLPNDQIIYTVNPTYRDPNKPYFSSVNLKGGGDPASAAQSVLISGDWDYAWNVVVQPAVIAEYEQGGNGSFRARGGIGLERIHINFSDPRTEGPDGQLSYWENPHPILSDPAVRQAIALAIDRDLIVNQFYDPRGDRTTANFLVGVPPVESPNTSYAVDPERAARILDEAGWTLSGDVREKDGVPLELNFFTSINAVRQNTQAVVKQNLEAVGFGITLGEVDSAIYFDSSAGNTQNYAHMYCDMNMFTSNPSSPTPIDYMLDYYAGPDGSNFAQASNGWTGPNFQRYRNAEYDQTMDQIQSGAVTSIDEVNQLLIRLNDILIEDAAVIPLVNLGPKYCVHSSLVHGDLATGEDNLANGGFDGSFWNVVNWNRSTPVER